jgi:hypothetical protein
MISSSFSLKIGQGINGGNGYGIVEAETEYNDNSWDADSNIIYKIATAYHKDYKKSFHIHFDLGNSTSDPYNILGIGREIKKKMDGNIGIKFMGAHNALCRYSPDMFYAICKTTNGPVVIMEYAIGDHIKKIKEIMESGSRDYREVDKWCEEEEVIKKKEAYDNNCFNHPVIQQVYNTIKDDFIKEELKRITSGGQDHYTMLINVYNSPLPDDIPEGINKTITFSQMLYYKQLISGKKIIYLNPDNNKIELNSTNAITPLGDISQFNRVVCKNNVYELNDGILFRVALHTENTTGISTSSKIFYVTDSQALIGNRSFKVKLITDDIAIPTNAIYRGDITLSSSCLSEAAQNQQTIKLAEAALGTRDSLRGLYCDYNRILGLPFWNTGKDTWGAVRNAGGIRSILSFTSQWIAENIVQILCEKQRTNMTNAHQVLKKLFDVVIYKTIIKRYSEYNNKNTCSSGVKEWDLNLLYSQITNTPLPRPPTPPTPPTPPPRPATPNDTESESDASSVTSDESTSSSEVEIPPRNITFNLCTREIIVMNAGQEIIRINNNGNGSGLRDWLIGTYDKLNNDVNFIAWVRAFGILNRQKGV